MQAITAGQLILVCTSFNTPECDHLLGKRNVGFCQWWWWLEDVYCEEIKIVCFDSVLYANTEGEKEHAVYQQGTWLWFTLFFSKM